MSYNLLKGKRGIIFGALNEQSIAWKVAEKAVEEGAAITLSNTPVAVRMGEVSALSEKLNCEVIPADATSVEDLENVDYVVRKYGKDQVVQIVTFGTLAAKGVVRDVGRVLGLPYSMCDTIAKMIPGDLGMTLDKALTMNPDLKKAYNEDEQVHYLIDMSRRLEGLPRHTSMHAAGVVIGSRSIDEFVPLSRASDGTITTQFTMTTIEELGLLKMDFLVF